MPIWRLVLLRNSIYMTLNDRNLWTKFHLMADLPKLSTIPGLPFFAHSSVPWTAAFQTPAQVAVSEVFLGFNPTANAHSISPNPLSAARIAPMLYNGATLCNEDTESWKLTRIEDFRKFDLNTRLSRATKLRLIGPHGDFGKKIPAGRIRGRRYAARIRALDSFNSLRQHQMKLSFQACRCHTNGSDPFSFHVYETPKSVCRQKGKKTKEQCYDLTKTSVRHNINPLLTTYLYSELHLR